MIADDAQLAPGERAVFAAAFVSALERTSKTMDAAMWAVAAVKCLRRAGELAKDAPDDLRAMLEDMLGHQGDLICQDGRTAGFTASPDSCVLCGRPADSHRRRS